YLIDEKKTLIDEVKDHSTKLDIILDSTHDGMIAIDIGSRITLINKRAESITDLKRSDIIGKNMKEVMPASQLSRVIKTGKTEVNKTVKLQNNRTIVTSRVPMYKGKELIGAFGVFKD